MIDFLKKLAVIDSVAVWVTSRQQYFIERQKEMFNFIEVSVLNEDELKAIYASRIKAFNNGVSVFSEDVLQELITGFRGIAGSLLYECFLFWRHHLHSHPPGSEALLGKEHLEGYLETAVQGFLENPETLDIFEQITKAVAARKTEMQIKDVKKGHGLVYRVLLPKIYGQDTYVVLPLFAKAIRKLAG